MEITILFFSFFTDWMECIDNTSGYPYYWNRETNEVKWDRPPEMGPPPASVSTTLPAPSGPSKTLISNPSNQQIKSTKKSSSSSKNENSRTDIKAAIAKDPALENAIKKLKKSKTSKSKTPPEVCT